MLEDDAHDGSPKIQIIKWQQIDTCLTAQYGEYYSNKIAGFDLDGTLIRTKSGNIFGKGTDDWQFWNEKVKEKISQLHHSGFKIVIFTNQAGISKGALLEKDLKIKIQNILKQLNVPILVLISLDTDQYRKPRIKMWELATVKNNHLEIDRDSSFYCGDAAGRKTQKNKDFSNSDLAFAFNIGLKFRTPQNIFQNCPQIISQIKGFDPKKYLSMLGKNLFEDSEQNQPIYLEKDFVIFCGSPSSGKTTFWMNYLPKYERVCLDDLKTNQKCLNKAEQLVKLGKSIVIDCTNPTRQRRQSFIKLAVQHGYKPRSFFFLADKQLCFHLDQQKVSNPAVKHFTKRNGKIPIFSWFKRFQQPTLEQGFFQIKKVNFIPKFHNQLDQQYFSLYKSL